MEQENFYIVIDNRYFRHEHANDDYHIERVFDKKDILDLLENELKDPHFMSCNSLVVTNDKKLLTTFLITINEEELKMLCRVSDFDKKQIRINKDYFEFLDKKVYDYFLKIKDGLLISATMDWTFETIYGGYDDPTIGVDSERFEGWIENKEFNYFKTPHRYLNEKESNKVFHLDDIKKANLETLKRLVNINILEIGKDDNNPNINWELRKDMLKYYDKISSKRLYISQKHLDLLSKNNELVFTIDTQIDQNHYIEFYVTGIEELENEKYDPDPTGQLQNEARNEMNGNYDNGDWGGLTGDEAELGFWNTD